MSATSTGSCLGKDRGDVLQVTEFPPGAVPRGAFSKIEDLIGDRVVLRSIVVGKPLLASKVSDRGATTLALGSRCSQDGLTPGRNLLARSAQA
jgi:Flp pilus assembly protein CpaB